jgi:hypothetical protein
MIKQKEIPRLIAVLEEKAKIALQRYEAMIDSDNPQTRECCVQSLAEHNIYTDLLEVLKYSNFVRLI